MIDLEIEDAECPNKEYRRPASGESIYSPEWVSQVCYCLNKRFLIAASDGAARWEQRADRPVSLH